MQEFIEHHNVHVICVTETHLLCSMPDSFVDIPCFRIIRSDAPGTFAKHGVCIYAKSHVKLEHVVTPCPNCVAIHLTELNVYVIAIYRPPSSTAEDNHLLQAFLSSFCTDRDVVIVRDFNLPSLSWKTTTPASHASICDAQFYDCFVFLGLTQWISAPTYPRSGSTLDLILTTEDDRIGSAMTLPPLPGCDHCPICL